jgi:transcriptional regulator with XRE-family HTH domain
METPPALTTFAARLNWLRSAAGLTQHDFAALCGVTKSYVSRLEHAQRRAPSLKFLAACATALNIPIDWLRHGTGPTPQVSRFTIPPSGPVVPSSRGPLPPPTTRDLQVLMRLILASVPVPAETWLNFTARIRQLADRYAAPLPQLTQEVETLATRVGGHLKKMGAILE